MNSKDRKIDFSFQTYNDTEKCPRLFGISKEELFKNRASMYWIKYNSIHSTLYDIYVKCNNINKFFLCLDVGGYEHVVSTVKGFFVDNGKFITNDVVIEMFENEDDDTKIFRDKLIELFHRDMEGDLMNFCYNFDIDEYSNFKDFEIEMFTHSLFLNRHGGVDEWHKNDHDFFFKFLCFYEKMKRKYGVGLEPVERYINGNVPSKEHYIHLKECNNISDMIMETLPEEVDE